MFFTLLNHFRSFVYYSNVSETPEKVVAGGLACQVVRRISVRFDVTCFLARNFYLERTTFGVNERDAFVYLFFPRSITKQVFDSAAALMQLKMFDGYLSAN